MCSKINKPNVSGKSGAPINSLFVRDGVSAGFDKYSLFLDDTGMKNTMNSNYNQSKNHNNGSYGEKKAKFNL